MERGDLLKEVIEWCYTRHAKEAMDLYMRERTELRRLKRRESGYIKRALEIIKSKGSIKIPKI